MSVLKMSSLGLLLLNVLLLLISLSTTHWIDQPGANFGLWRYCIQLGCGSVPSTSSLDAVRAFIIISFLLLLVATSFQILEIWHKTVLDGTNKQKLTAILSLSAACSAVLAMSIFTGTARRGGSPVGFSWSFDLGWVSAALSLLAGVVAFVSFKQEAQ
ncbi:lens fiber membrane intrinsic protein-like [Lissotriton helveticus]